MYGGEVERSTSNRLPEEAVHFLLLLHRHGNQTPRSGESRGSSSIKTFDRAAPLSWFWSFIISRMKFKSSQPINSPDFPCRPLTVKRPLLPDSFLSNSGHECENSSATCCQVTCVSTILTSLVLLTARTFDSWLKGKRPAQLQMPEVAVPVLTLFLSQVSVWRRGPSTDSSLASTPASTYT